MYWPIYIGMLISSILYGFGLSLFWVGAQKYVTECANENNKGTFNGIFWVASMGAYLSGNLMAAFVIPATS